MGNLSHSDNRFQNENHQIESVDQIENFEAEIFDGTIISDSESKNEYHDDNLKEDTNLINDLTLLESNIYSNNNNNSFIINSFIINGVGQCESNYQEYRILKNKIDSDEREFREIFSKAQNEINNRLKSDNYN